jgi:hypothetical protein
MSWQTRTLAGGVFWAFCVAAAYFMLTSFATGKSILLLIQIAHGRYDVNRRTIVFAIIDLIPDDAEKGGQKSWIHGDLCRAESLQVDSYFYAF